MCDDLFYRNAPSESYPETKRAEIVPHPAMLGHSAQTVLEVFAKLHKSAGDTLRYDEITDYIGDAQVREFGQQELSHQGLVVEHRYALELTSTGQAAIASLFGPNGRVAPKTFNGIETQTPNNQKIRPWPREPDNPSTRYVAKRFALKFAILFVFALAQIPSRWGFGYAFVVLTALSGIICIGLALVRREPWTLARLNYWHEALAFLTLTLTSWAMIR